MHHPSFHALIAVLVSALAAARHHRTDRAAVAAARHVAREALDAIWAIIEGE